MNNNIKASKDCDICSNPADGPFCKSCQISYGKVPKNYGLKDGLTEDGGNGIIYAVFLQGIVSLSDLIGNIIASLVSDEYKPNKQHIAFYPSVGSFIVGRSKILKRVRIKGNSVFANDPIWVGTFTAHYCVLHYADRVEKDLIACFDFTKDAQSVDGDFKVTWSGAMLTIHPYLLDRR